MCNYALPILRSTAVRGSARTSTRLNVGLVILHKCGFTHLCACGLTCLHICAMELRDVIPAVYDEEDVGSYASAAAQAAIGGEAPKMEMCSYISVAG